MKAEIREWWSELAEQLDMSEYEVPPCFADHKHLTGNSDTVADVLCNVGLKGRLIAAAASLSLHKLSEFDDDYPQRFPKRVLREIEKHNDHLGDIARELMAIKDAL